MDEWSWRMKEELVLLVLERIRIVFYYFWRFDFFAARLFFHALFMRELERELALERLELLLELEYELELDDEVDDEEE